MKKLYTAALLLGFSALVVMGCYPPTAVPPAAAPDQPAGSTDPTVSPDQPVSSDDPAATPLPQAAPSGDFVDGGPALVDSIEIQIMESFPVQVSVLVNGNLRDGCSQVGEITTTREGNEFVVTIGTLRQAGVMCTEALVPFEQVVPLDVEGLPAGTYTVTVNGVSEQFELAVDNA